MTTTTETKTFSTKFNAKAGAQKAGVDLATVVFLQNPEGRWFWDNAAERHADDFDHAKASLQTMRAKRDEDRAATLDSPIAEQSRAAEAEADDIVEAEVAAGATGPEVDAKTKVVDDAFRAWLGRDDVSDEFMRSLFTHCFLAGQEAAAAKPARKARPVTERKPRDAGPSKREQAADLLLNPQGATSREILDATGWTAVSIPALAKASGLSLRQVKEGKTTRYFAVPLGGRHAA